MIRSSAPALKENSALPVSMGGRTPKLLKPKKILDVGIRLQGSGIYQRGFQASGFSTTSRFYCEVWV